MGIDFLGYTRYKMRSFSSIFHPVLIRYQTPKLRLQLNL